MQYQHAVRLGLLHQQLRIPQNDRIVLQMIAEGTGAFVWDIDTGTTYIIIQGTSPIKGSRDVPKHVKEIVSATDDDLKNRWRSTMGWNEVRETIFSELAYRGIDILGIEGIR